MSPLGFISCLLDHRRDLLRGLAEAAQHVGGDPSGSVVVGRPTPILIRANAVRAQSLPDGLQPVVPGQPTAVAHADLAEWEVDLIVDHEHPVKIELERSSRRADRLAGFIHVGLGQKHGDPWTSRARPGPG